MSRRTFIRFRPLDAYRLDIAGSIAGIAAFSLLSFLDAKPVVWALVVALVMLLIYGRRAGLLQVVAVVAIVLLLWSESLSSSDIWSPYYRISVMPAPGISTPSASTGSRTRTSSRPASCRRSTPSRILSSANQKPRPPSPHLYAGPPPTEFLLP